VFIRFISWLICFPFSPGLNIRSNANPGLLFVLKFINFIFSLSTPPLGDFQLPEARAARWPRRRTQRRRWPQRNERRPRLGEARLDRGSCCDDSSPCMHNSEAPLAVARGVAVTGGGCDPRHECMWLRGDNDRTRRGLRGLAVCTIVWASFVYQLHRSGGLGGVLRHRSPPIHCLCMQLLVEPILGFSLLIMIYDIGIYATFYNDICFA
jgi:hypothetical protein